MQTCARAAHIGPEHAQALLRLAGRAGHGQHARGSDNTRGGANHITGEGISLEGEPITSQGRKYPWRGSQSHHRGGNMQCP
eukprot:8818976-Pyramimonas_sp.AAC.1